MTSHCYRIFAAASQPMMGGGMLFLHQRSCFGIGRHLIVTMEALDPAQRKRTGNWNILTMSLTQSGKYV